jgi:hypothetical protein
VSVNASNPNNDFVYASSRIKQLSRGMNRGKSHPDRAREEGEAVSAGRSITNKRRASEFMRRLVELDRESWKAMADLGAKGEPVP